MTFWAFTFFFLFLSSHLNFTQKNSLRDQDLLYKRGPVQGDRHIKLTTDAFIQ